MAVQGSFVQSNFSLYFDFLRQAQNQIRANINIKHLDHLIWSSFSKNDMKHFIIGMKISESLYITDLIEKFLGRMILLLYD